MSEMISGGVVTASKKRRPSAKDLAEFIKEGKKRKLLGRQQRRARRRATARLMKGWSEVELCCKEPGGTLSKKRRLRLRRRLDIRAWQAAGRPPGQHHA